MYSDTLDIDISSDVPVRRPALLSRKALDVPVRPMDAKGLNGKYFFFSYWLSYVLKSYQTSDNTFMRMTFFQFSLKFYL